MNNQNGEINNNNLLNAIEEMNKDQATENVSRFINEMIAAKFIVPVGNLEEEAIVNPDGTKTLKPNTSVKLKYLTNTENEDYIIVFSDWEEVKAWDQEQNEGIVLDFYGLSEAVFKGEQFTGFAINPFTANFLMNRERIAAINKAMMTARRED